MGVAAATAKQNTRFTHSAITEISTIEQEEPSGGAGGARGGQARMRLSVAASVLSLSQIPMPPK